MGGGELSGLVSSVSRTLSSKLRGPGFKSRPGTVGHYNDVGCSAWLKTSFELNPVTEGKKGTFLFPKRDELKAWPRQPGSIGRFVMTTYIHNIFTSIHTIH